MAATATELTLSLVASDITRPIIAGAVTPRGITLHAQAAESIDNLSRRMVSVEYDVGEMSFATYIMARREGVPVVALPFFTSGRNFQHRNFTVLHDSPIDDPAGFRGKRVGTPQYWLSTAVWQRWMLQEIHGVRPEEIEWVTIDPERFANVPVPPGVRVRRDTSGRQIRDLLEAGEIDASLSTPGAPPPPPDAPDHRRPAYRDPLAAQREFYGRTHIFPTNHVVVMKEEALQRDPWVIESLGEAFEAAKAVAKPPVPQGMEDLMGDDPWAFGIGPNRPALAAFVAACRDQGAWEGPLTVEQLFPSGLPERYR
jgi:4,5-dihydroxyphthalate decarboxylase